jgi:tRNA A-37 threonylcarbamoyl transferase component Bud32
MAGQARILKSDAHSQVGLLTLEGQLCYLKFYRYKSGLQRLGYRLGRGRAVQAFDAALRLQAAGVSVPRPLACLRVSGGVLLLTEGVADSVDLKSLWLQGLHGERLAQVMQTAARALASLHSAGFSHGDCKWSNFLCAGDDILFIDLEGVRGSAPGARGSVRDLARFTLNAEDMGLEQGIYDDFLATYSGALQLATDALREAVLNTLRPLRERHLQRYGQRGHCLL